MSLLKNHRQPFYGRVGALASLALAESSQGICAVGPPRHRTDRVRKVDGCSISKRLL
jgi:hypothetical protein